MKDAPNTLRIIPVNRHQFLAFNLLEFRFFWNSQNGKAIFFGNPHLLKPLVIIPYMLAATVYNFGGKRLIVKLGDQTATMFVLKIRRDALIVSSLAVSPNYRRCGIGLFILNYAEKLCRQMRIEWLELAVLKVNTPAQWLS